MRANRASSCFAAKSDAGQRVVDFVGHAGCQEADAGETFGAHQLSTAFVHLMGEIAIHIPQAIAHIVEGLRQFLHLVAAVHRHPMLEVATGEAFGSLVEIANRMNHPNEKIA